MRTLKMFAVVLVVLLAFSGTALRADSLVINGPYNAIPFNGGSVGRGSIAGATLNGEVLPWLYCVQFNTNITVPGTYGATLVSHDGVIQNSDPNPTAIAAPKVAYLLSKWADGASKDQQIALQAAIWHVEGFGAMTTGAPQETLYNTMLTDLGSNTGDVTQYAWLAPGKSVTDNLYQGLVTRVPDGGVTLMLLGGALVGLETLRRKFRA